MTADASPPTKDLPFSFDEMCGSIRFVYELATVRMPATDENRAYCRKLAEHLDAQHRVTRYAEDGGRAALYVGDVARVLAYNKREMEHGLDRRVVGRMIPSVKFSEVLVELNDDADDLDGDGRVVKSRDDSANPTNVVSVAVWNDRHTCGSCGVTYYVGTDGREYRKTGRKGWARFGATGHTRCCSECLPSLRDALLQEEIHLNRVYGGSGARVGLNDGCRQKRTYLRSDC